MRPTLKSFAVLALGAVLIGGCATQTSTPTPTPSGPVDTSHPGTPAIVLVGSQWQLTTIQLKEDGENARKVADPSLYTVSFEADGRALFRLSCNRASAPWKAAAGDVTAGVLWFGPVAGSRALCPQPSYDQMIMRDLPAVRSFLMRFGRLHMTLAGDGGQYVWTRMKPAQ